MSISAPFIHRPVATTLVMVALIFFGGVAYRALPVSDLPNVDLPTLLVTASLPGASPDEMASSVATPLEKQLSTIAGLSSMSSASTLGNTQITLQFELSRSLDAAAQDVQAAMSAAQGQLPATLPQPPSYKKVNPADQPILYVALTSPTLPLSQIDDFGETLMAQRMSMIEGVAQVQVFGAQKYAVRVRVDPRALASRGIGIEEVSQAIQQGNSNVPSGKLSGADTNLTLDANGQLSRASDYRPLVVAYRNGAPVRLEALGSVFDSVEDDETAAWFNQQRAVILAIQRQPGTNTVKVADSVRALLPTFEKQLPPSLTLHVLFDRSEGIRASVRDVELTLGLTLVLVILVIFLFLRNAWATTIPSIALPLSLTGTFGAMYMLGFSLDNLSLMALTLSVGFVVDDAIVMLENIFRHLEMGKTPLQAAIDGAAEVGFTIVSMTLSLVAVFIPILFMGGILGRLFKEFSITIAVALLLSGFISLTLTPMLASRFLKPGSHGGAGQGPLSQKLERVFEGMVRVYERGLVWSLDHVKLVLGASAIILLATGLLFVKVPKGFLPTEDQGLLFAFTEAQEGESFEGMVRHQKELAAIAMAQPGVERTMSSVGGAGRGTSNGVIFTKLAPRSERPSAEKILAQLRPGLMSVPGINAYLQIPPPLRITGQLTKSQYQFTLQGSDTAELYAAAPRLEARMKTIPGLLDVTSDLRLKNPQIKLDVNRDQAAIYGVSMAQIEDALYDAYGNRQISTIYAPTNSYHVILEVEPRFQLDPDALSILYVRSSSGQLVPLQALASLTPSVGPLAVNHTGQLPAVTVSFNLAEGTSLGPAVEEVEKAGREVLPPDITTSFQGTAGAFQSSLSSLGILLVLAIMVIYIVLGILYESFIHPLTILSALPFAGFGALLTLWIFGRDLDVYAFVGVILLVGLVKKNGIMMVDFAIEAERGGKSPREAIHQACLVRFRPILMTSVAAFMGTLPIALGIGAGAESRQPLGLAVVGGLLFSQVLTLFVTPVFYLFLDRLVRRRPATEGSNWTGNLPAPSP